MRKKKWEGLLFISPYLIGILCFCIIPIVYCIGLSFTNSNLFKPFAFVGFENYRQLFKDINFFAALKTTFLYVGLTMPALTILSLLLAVLVNSSLPFVRLFRTLYFIPGILSAAAVSCSWIFIFNKDFGLLNQYLGLTGKVNWLGDPSYVVLAMAIVCIWQQVSYNFVIYLAALQDIPTSLTEAAKIDGAGPVTRFFKITVPLITPTIFMVIFTTLTFQLQQFIYAQIIMVGRFGSKTATYYIYETGFKANEMGYGSAMSVVFFLMIFLIMLALWLSQKKWVFYNN